MSEEQSYLKILKKVMNYENLDDVKENCCLNIATETTNYNFCFIDFETEDYLGISVTHSDFTERFVLLVKKYIVSMSVVYQQDMELDSSNVDGYI